ncbi:hypothetical protein ASE35_20495 [Lysobacter sp. Root916]|nr:hypothetical protein ASE35_20495 [Lysobacter sp. Root916]
MYTWVLAIGRPISTGPAWLRSIRTQVEYVVVSLGPYRFTTSSADVPANSCATSAGFKASPARLIVRTVSGTH